VKLEIETNIFPVAEGNVRGIITGMVRLDERIKSRTKPFRLGLAYLMTDCPAELLLEMPKGKVTGPNALWLAGALREFAAAVCAAEAQPAPISEKPS
jgi:hypothetical protein